MLEEKTRKRGIKSWVGAEHADREKDVKIAREKKLGGKGIQIAMIRVQAVAHYTWKGYV